MIDLAELITVTSNYPMPSDPTDSDPTQTQTPHRLRLLTDSDLTQTQTPLRLRTDYVLFLHNQRILSESITITVRRQVLIRVS